MIVMAANFTSLRTGSYVKLMPLRQKEIVCFVQLVVVFSLVPNLISVSPQHVSYYFYVTGPDVELFHGGPLRLVWILPRESLHVSRLV